VLNLVAAQNEETGTVTTDAADPGGDAAPVAATREDNTATWLATAALVVAVGAAAIAGLALRRRAVE